MEDGDSQVDNNKNNSNHQFTITVLYSASVVNINGLHTANLSLGKQIWGCLGNHEPSSFTVLQSKFQLLKNMFLLNPNFWPPFSSSHPCAAAWENWASQQMRSPEQWPAAG